MFATSFEAEEKSFRQKKTTVATVVTVAIHAVILLALLFTILTTPNPPFEESEGGMAVNFGFDEVGSGETQPFSYNPGPMESSSDAAPAAASSSAPEDVLSEENGEEDVVVPKVEDKPKQQVKPDAVYKPNTKPATNPTATNKPTKTENPNPSPTTNPDAVFTKGAYGKPNNSKGDGTGGGQGDQGKPDGDPNSKNYEGDGGDGTGPGSGSGPGYSLGNRKKVSIPAPQACSTIGKVVIKISVNRNGAVTAVDIDRFKSTTFDECNVANAKAAARKATFKADPDAPEIQQGTITYIYKVN
jgi:protein TonB